MLRKQLLEDSLSSWRREEGGRRLQVVEHLGGEDHLLMLCVVLQHPSDSLLDQDLLLHLLLELAFS